MKKIVKPLDSGSQSLSAASQNKKLNKTYPTLLKFGLRAERLAQHYDAVNGDPNIIRPTRFSAKEEKAVRDLYKSPPIGMKYIEELRASLAGETCPMCGGENPGQIDHYLTQKTYPEYACLSYNLVPACSCNQKRGALLFDSITKARILHPYYDNCLSQPLIDLKFDPDDTPPEFLINYIIANTDAAFENVKYHVENIVVKTNFLTYIGKRWSTLKFQPDNILPCHNDYRSNGNDFHTYLLTLSAAKSADKGSNSWEAIFLRSISNRNVSDWVFNNC